MPSRTFFTSRLRPTNFSLARALPPRKIRAVNAGASGSRTRTRSESAVSV